MREFKIVVLSCLAFAGLAAAQTNATGAWTIKATSQRNGPFSMTGQLTQSGQSITGTLSISGNSSVCTAPVTVSGKLIGTSISATLFTAGGYSMTLTGVVSQDFLSMSGTYSYGVFCGNGDSGPWTGTRTPSSTSTISSITSAASYEQNQVAAGGYVSIFGTGLADGIHYSTGAPYPTVLGTTEIFACATQTFNTSTCTAAGVAFASPGQVNVVLAGIGPTVQVLQSPTMYFVARVGGVVDAASGAGTPTPVTILPFAPSVFIAGNDCPMTAAAPNCVVNTGTAPNGRATRGVITDANGNLVWSENPARLGQSYTAWVTGLGSIKSGVRPSPAVQMTFLDVPAFGYPNPSYGIVAVTYAGAVPQFPGLYQINFQIPLTIGEGPDGYGAWPCGNYGWDLTLAINVGTYPTSNAIQIPLVIKSGDVACKP